MGTWGSGLYDNDLAQDLKSTIDTLCRLPFGGPRIVEILVEMMPSAVDEAHDEYTAFWLVVAERLHRKGIESHARSLALEVIDSGLDLAVQTGLGASAEDLKKRELVLYKLGTMLAEPPELKKRRTLKKPQPLLCEPGSVYAYPIDERGQPFNPYITAATVKQNPDFWHFEPVGWCAYLIVRTGYMFEYLAWYQIVRASRNWTHQPVLADASTEWVDQATLGTSNKNQWARLRTELLGSIEPPDLEPPADADTIFVTANDIHFVGGLGALRPTTDN